MNRLKVVICGKEYVLQTKEDATYVYNLGRALEKKINSLVETNNVSAYNASVMVALSLLDDLKHLDKDYSKLQQSCAEIDKIKEQRDTAFREIKRLNAKITQLEDSQRFKELGGVIPEYYTNSNNISGNNSNKNSKK